MTQPNATARELDRLMVKTYGPDYRDKAVGNALGGFRLRDVFEECGLGDPQVPPSPGVGLWQITTKGWKDDE